MTLYCLAQRTHPKLAVIASAATLMISAILPLAAQDAAGDPLPSLVLVVDGSGSMWGKLGDEPETKLALSQKHLIDALLKPNPKIRIGLASFGHRRAGNCSDAEVVVPPDADTSQTIQEQIAKLNPRGKGPLTLALQKTVAAIDPKSPSSIILVHDGYDNCRQDPCQIANDVATSHPKLKINVISLDLPPDATKAMSCLPQKTGGKLYSVRTAKGLQTAVQSAMALASLKPPKPAQRLSERADTDKTTNKAAQDTGPPRLRLTAHFRGADQQNIRDVSWTIVTPTDLDNPMIDRQATVLAENINPGRYIVRAAVGLAKTEQQVTIKEEGETRSQITFDAGVIRFEGPAQEAASGEQPDPIFLSLYRKDADEDRDHSRPFWIGAAAQSKSLIVPEGTYDLTIERGVARRKIGVEVAAGKSTPVQPDIEGGVLILGSTLAGRSSADGGGPNANQLSNQPGGFSAQVAYVISTDDPTAAGGRREVARSAASQAKFQLQPGTYYAQAQVGLAKRERRLAIGSDQIVRHQFQFDVARVKLEARVGNDPVPDSIPVTFEIYKQPTAPTSQPIAATSKQNPLFILPVGRYRVVASMTGAIRGQSQIIQIETGQQKTITVPVEAGKVVLRHSASLGPQARPVYQIRRPDGKVVWRGRPGPETAALLTPGSYTLENRVSRGDRRALEVVQGQTTVIDLGT